MKNKHGIIKKMSILALGMSMAIGVGVVVGNNNKNAVSVSATTSTGSASINLGSGAGKWNCGKDWKNDITSSKSDSIIDALGNTWTLTYTYPENTYSRTANSEYIQFGSKDNPATSVELSTTMSDNFFVSALYSKWGGFSSTAGTVSMKIGNTEVKTGSLSGTSDIEVKQADGSYSSGVVSNTITITLNKISKGIKLYGFSYTLSSNSGPTLSIIDFAGTYKTNYILPGQSGTFSYGWTGTAPTITSTSWTTDSKELTLTSSTGAFTASNEVTALTEVVVNLSINSGDYTANKTFYICPHALDANKKLARESLKSTFTIDDEFAIYGSSLSKLKATFLDVGEINILDSTNYPNYYGGTLSFAIDDKPVSLGDKLVKSQNGKYVQISYTYGSDTINLSSRYSITVNDKEIDKPSLNNGWNLVTDASTLASGDRIIITAPGGSNIAISETQNANNRGIVTDIVKSDDKKQLNNKGSAAIFTLGIINSGTYAGKFTFYGKAIDDNAETSDNTLDGEGCGYLWASTSATGNNFLRTKSGVTDKNINEIWNISISNSVATISLVGNTNRYIAYNSNPTDNIFSAYLSGQNKPYIYKDTTVGAYEYVQNWICDNLHFQDIAIADNSDGTSCSGDEGYYLIAKAALATLETTHEGCIAELQSNASFADARNRYEAWASANHDANPYDGNESIQNNLNINFVNITNNENNDLFAVIIVVFSLVSFTAIGGYFFIRKSKEHY